MHLGTWITAYVRYIIEIRNIFCFNCMSCRKEETVFVVAWTHFKTRKYLGECRKVGYWEREKEVDQK